MRGRGIRRTNIKTANESASGTFVAGNCFSWRKGWPYICGMLIHPIMVTNLPPIGLRITIAGRAPD